MEQNYDAILYLDKSTINEDNGTDSRNYSTKPYGGVSKPIKGVYVDYVDPKLYASWSFGKRLKSDISSMGKDFSCEVTDFGKEIVVTVTHSDTVTGRSAGKTFLVVFTGTKGDAFVKSHSNKWRSISGVDQASQYIKSVCSNLAGVTQTKM